MPVPGIVYQSYRERVRDFGFNHPLTVVQRARVWAEIRAYKEWKNQLRVDANMALIAMGEINRERA